MAYIQRVKLRALAWGFAIVLAAFATIAFAGVPTWPVIGMAVAAAAVSVTKLTTKLLKPTCYDCGHDLAGEPIGMQGIACPKCGSVNTPNLVAIAKMDKRNKA